MPAPLPARPSRTLPLTILAAALLLLAAAAQRLLRQQRELRTLREELSALQLAHREVSARQSLTTDAEDRARRLEQMLASVTAERDKDSARAASQTSELERVITFLRAEISAAEATIERLRTEPRPADPAPGKKASRTGREP